MPTEPYQRLDSHWQPIQTAVARFMSDTNIRSPNTEALVGLTYREIKWGTLNDLGEHVVSGAIVEANYMTGSQLKVSTEGRFAPAFGEYA